jgi:hypothetical protein
MIDWVSIVRTSHRRFSNYVGRAPNRRLHRRKPQKNPQANFDSPSPQKHSFSCCNCDVRFPKNNIYLFLTKNSFNKTMLAESKIGNLRGQIRRFEKAPILSVEFGQTTLNLSRLHIAEYCNTQCT